MSRLSNLLRELEKSDSRLANDIRREVATLSDRRAFGLNFERHVPESVELPGRPIRRGDKVRFLPERGESTSSVDSGLWQVVRITKTKGNRVAELVRAGTDDSTERATRNVDDLVAVAEFRDPIHPGLVSNGKVERGGDKPFHTVINAENYHALEALLYTHEGKVDAIYIDPPYNTGAQDWKYNNDYVDRDDQYRHSKWLAMMERRLLLARRLLNPDDSALIVTIDEKEYLRLGLLLEQTFPDADVQMVSSVINRAGSPRAGRFSRVDEYIYYVIIGDAHVAPWSSTMLPDNMEKTTPTMPTVWFTAVRRGSGASRAESKNLFYAVVIDAETGEFRRVGDPLQRETDRNDFPLEPGELPIWPLGADGGENRWRFSAELMRTYFANGTARLGRRDPSTGLRSVTYLQPGTLQNIENGTFIITGRTPEGAVELALGESAKAVAPRTVWNLTGHFARDHGSHLIGALIGNRKFPFPKALYAVEDALRFVVANKPDATILDFFAGSGTTAHAVARLNKQDGGRRQTILVTNNEVSADEQAALRDKKLRPGDPEWEALGICEYITRPRLEAAITGKTPKGDPIKGDYKFTDEFPMAEGFEENIEFFNMTYEAPLAVAHNKAFARIAPLLWLRAGSEGRRIDAIPKNGFDIADTYAILFDVDKGEGFVAALTKASGLRVVFIVSDDERAFQAICSDLPDGVEAVRLYSSYLTNFEINARAE